MRVQPDWMVSIPLDVLAGMELLFLGLSGSLFQGSMIALGIFLVALVLDPLVNRRKGDTDDVEVQDVEGRQRWKILADTIGAVAIFYALSIFVPVIPPQYIPLLATITPAIAFPLGGLFVVLLAVSEAEFFHRFLTNLAVSRLGPLGFPLIGAAAVAYHLFVYGDSPTNLLIVFAAFTALAGIAWYSGLLAPVVLAHVIINGLASHLFVQLIPHMILGLPAILPISLPLVLGFVLILKFRPDLVKRRWK